jgi:hypothetical protein
MITVYVGLERTECILHENLLRHKSGFFNEKLKVKTDVGLPKSITLPAEDPVVFGHFVSWLYKDSIYCSKDHGESDWEHLFEWCRLELFAKKLGLASLEEDAVWQYGHCCKNAALHRPRIEVIKFLYENSINDSKIKLLVVEKLLQIYLDPYFDDHKFMGTALSCNPAFAEDFSTSLKAHSQITNASQCGVKQERKPCYIHNSETATPPSKTRKRAPPGSGDKRLKKNKAVDGTPGLHSDAES